jgi:hypothetical protein
MDGSPVSDGPTVGAPELGAFESEYQMGSSYHKLLLVSCIVVGVLSLVPAAAIPFVTQPPGLTTEKMAASLFVGSPGLLSLLGVFALLRRWHWRTLVFENGVVLERNRAAEQILWTDIKHYYEERLLLHGRVETDHELRLRLRSGRKITINKFYKNSGELARTIRLRCSAALYSQATEQLRRHEPVSFGFLKLDPEGLAAGKDKLAWDEVEKIDVEQRGPGYALVVMKRGKRAPWFLQPVPRFPNIDVFLALIRGIRQQS